MALTACLTVGSTSFPALVSSALSPSVLDVLRSFGCSQFVVQAGSSPVSFSPSNDASGLHVQLHDFLDDIDDVVSGADLVISHAGNAQLLPEPKPSCITITMLIKTIF
jgi:UDP-N-acetylglucosamine transferase subunit ALG13